MRYLINFANFNSGSINESIKKIKNITDKDISDAIKFNGRVFATIIKNLPNNDPNEPLRPVSIDDDGLVTVEFDGNEYEIDLEDIEKVILPD